VLWSELPVHVIDFEGDRSGGIVEYGVVTLFGGEIAALHTRLCRPRRPVLARDTRVHGLSDGDVQSAAPFELDWDRFAAWRASGVFAAHFSGTENALLRDCWPCPRLSPDFLRPGVEIAEWGPWIDTGRLLLAAQPRRTSAALADGVAALGLERELEKAAARWCPSARAAYHCAPYDALAAALLLHRLAVSDTGKAWTLARVLAASTGNNDRRDDLLQERLF